MHKADIITAVTTLVTQASNGYHLSDKDIEDAEVAIDTLQQLLMRAKRG